MIHNNITDRNTINEMDEEWERIENDKRLLEAVVPDIFDSLVTELLYGLVKVIIGM